MHITMIGAGYVGLVSGACFSDFGHHIVCVDTDAAKVEALRQGRIPIFEPGLDEIVMRNVKAGRLSFTTSIAEGLDKAEVVFIAVGTPSRRGDGHADISYVLAAAREIAQATTRPLVVVTKSTVPVGTGDEIEKVVAEVGPSVKITVVSNPEFLREGAAIEDFKRPDRIVIGTDDPDARDAMAAVYRPLNLNQAPILFTGRRTAELTKYAANAFLATKITFINEIADLAEKVGANVQEIARGIGLDNRIGSKFLHAGPGYGGSCFPKDTLALVRTAKEFGAPARIVETVVDINDKRKAAMADRIIAAAGGSLAGKTVAVLGLTFKPNTDDMRDAPSLEIIPALQKAGAAIRAHDPEGMAAAAKLLDGVTFCEGPYDAAKDASVLVIITEWDVYRALDIGMLKAAMLSPVIVDLRNIYVPAELASQGFRYVSIGRPPV
ncbi:MAG: UDP-glucose/GDP-mannose dehydrogenase family protein [Xanthobacteraceae bacterium]